MKEKVLIAYLVFICLFSIDAFAVSLVKNDVIFSVDGKYAAFTSLVEFKGSMYCSFRLANNHVDKKGADKGIIVVLKSKDGNKWKPYKEFSCDTLDLRDPKLIVAPYKKMYLYYHGVNYIDGKSSMRQTMMLHLNAFSRSRQFTKLHFSSHNKNNWLWNAKWINGTLYGYRYLPVFGLVASTDGVNFSEVVIPSADRNTTEADVEQMANGQLLSIVRVNGSNTIVGISNPDGSGFIWHDSGVRLESPEAIRVGDDIYVSGRYVRENKRTTSLFKFNPITYDLDYLLDISESGDCGYPGMAYGNGKLYISYYYKNNPSRTSIYLAEIKL